MKIPIRLGLLILFSGFGLLGGAQAVSGGSEENLELRIVPDKMEYYPGSRIVVKSIVTNRSNATMYVARNLSSCLRWEGYIHFQILDKQNRNVQKTGCVTDRAGKGFDIVHELSDARLWIALEPYEIYGTEEDFELPREKGTYRIHAELVPPQLDERQERTLSQHKISVLRIRRSAPVITITVK
jgi:hypothetical protein